MKVYAQKQPQPQQQSSPNSTKPGAKPLEENYILYLQRTIGNQAVQRLLKENAEGSKAAPPIVREVQVLQQRGSYKPLPLEIGSPGHSHEREADTVAGNIESNPLQSRVEVSAASTTPGVQRQVESDEENSPEEEMEAGALPEGDESEDDVLDSADSDIDEESEEETDVAQASEGDALKTGGVVGSPPKKKKKPAVRRRKVHRTDNFWGRLTNIFGGKRGIYTRNWGWSWGKGASQRGPSTQDTRTVVLKADDAADFTPQGDLQTPHGGLFYEGEPIIGTFELPFYDQQSAVSLPIPKPALAWNEKATVISVTKTMTGTLKYKFGDKSDPASGPRAQIVIEREDKISGLWVPVHDTTLLTTNGNWQTETLNVANLKPDTTYRVRIYVERWENGRTRVDYSLDIRGHVEATVNITKTTAGKSKVTKEPHKIRIKL